MILACRAGRARASDLPRLLDPLTRRDRTGRGRRRWAHCWAAGARGWSPNGANDGQLLDRFSDGNARPKCGPYKNSRTTQEPTGDFKVIKKPTNC